MFFLLYVPAPIVAWIFWGETVAYVALFPGWIALGLMAWLDHEGFFGQSEGGDSGNV